LLGIRNSWLAWQVNNAVIALGVKIENERHRSKGERSIEDILKNGFGPRKGTLAELMALFGQVG
jgi:hypothetical protein